MPFNTLLAVICCVCMLRNGQAMVISMFPGSHHQPDVSLPVCNTRIEPCGFYLIPEGSRKPTQWVSSWCRCAENTRCVDAGLDKRMMAYRQICVPNNKTPNFN